MCLDERGQIDDPVEPAPAVLGWMAAQDQQLVVERRLPDRGVHERDRVRRLLSTSCSSAGSGIDFGKSPLQIDDHRTRRTGADRREGCTAGRTHVVPARLKELFALPTCSRRNEQVEVGELPHGEAAKNRHRQHGAFQGHGLDAVFLEQCQQPQQFSGAKQIGAGIVTEVSTELAPHDPWNISRRLPESDVEMRHDAMPQRRRHEARPVAVQTRLLSRLPRFQSPEPGGRTTAASSLQRRTVGRRAASVTERLYPDVHRKPGSRCHARNQRRGLSALQSQLHLLRKDRVTARFHRRWPAAVRRVEQGRCARDPRQAD